jgi:hypothetical protein
MTKIPLTARQSWENIKEINRFAKVVAAARLMRKSFALGSGWLPAEKEVTR